MSENQTDQHSPIAAPQDKPAPRKPKASPGVGLAKSLAFIALVLVIVAGLYGYQTVRDLKAELAEQQSQLDNLAQNKAFLDFKQFVAGKFDALNDQYYSTQGQVEKLADAVSQAAAEAARDQRGWILAETRYLMNMATSRLRLLRDVNAAIEALKGADQRLATLNDPAFFPVREALADEISALQALGTTDSNGIALKLMAFGKQVSRLPPAKIIMSETEEIILEDELDKGSFWADIARWIGLKHTNRPWMAMPRQEDIFYLDQLLRLELEAARHAALRFDETTYSHHIDAALALLGKHYQQDNQHVQSLMAELRELRGSAVFPRLPDISGSSVALSKAQSRYNPATKPAQTEEQAL